MAPDELKIRARRAVEEIFSQGDLAVANELISPDCVHYNPGGWSVPRLDALRDWLALTLSIFPDFHAIVKERETHGVREQRSAARSGSRLNEPADSVRG